MRWSETITIYLATGAPFGVSCFLRSRVGERRTVEFLRAVAIGLFWPLAVIWILWAGNWETRSNAARDRRVQGNEARIQIAKRRLLAALHGMSELATCSANTMHKDLERAVCVLRESIETYVGLAPAVEEAAVDTSPNGNSKELFRVAGYKAEDLAVAATCANRRNKARIIQHHLRARTQMVHALADIREAIESTRGIIHGNHSAKEQLRLVFSDVYKQAIDLLILLGDEETASRIAGLFNHQFSRRRRVNDTEMRKDSAHVTGDEPCTTIKSRLTQAPLSNETTMVQR